jgi:hypothetical protein
LFVYNTVILVDFRRLFGAKVGLVLEPRSSDPEPPQFDYGEQLPKPRPIMIQEGGNVHGEWRSQLAAELHSTDWDVCLANLISIPLRSLRRTIEGECFLDGAACLAEILNNIPKGKIVIVVSPAGILLDEQRGRFRAWLATAHRVETIIYMGSPAADSWVFIIDSVWCY